MSTQACDKIIALAVSQLGYKESGTNITKYSKFFDTAKSSGGAWQFYNTKKQGAEWCQIFLCYCFYKTVGADNTRKMLNIPKPADNCSAGVPYFYDYMKKWKVTTPQKGDIIFLNKCKHVGIVEGVSGKTIKTIEGNKSNKVARGSYAIGSSSIYAFCRPKWSVVPDPTPAPTPDPEPLPDPTPDPAPVPTPPTPTPKPKTYPKYKVTAKSGLNVRRGPGKSYGVVKTLKYGTTVTVYEQKNGWGKISKTSSQWVSMAYLKKV